ncbi:hypothetical protein JOD31_003391 [Methylopila capsulata]|uniref:Uncharacterized protein n=1 Tax=Methylopila capsulata TaxID=61654 RepID=A0A9W6IW08_9HYPH|nr:hypothetical protein [Methylopila capsulata]MBM7853140.1 hypothetical protein [Methylopila capsulata]GLK57646.1 hypothetical protein GCM10008170_36660 [Methylopila capsulata]
MPKLAQAARATLAQIATPKAPVVFDGDVLSELHEKKMIVFSIVGWRLTSGGWSALNCSPADCATLQIPVRAADTTETPRRRAGDLRAPRPPA